MRVSRRAFVDSALAAGAGVAIGGVEILAGQLATPRTLKGRFPDLSRHFMFEYYPWYATDPYRHWNEADLKKHEAMGFHKGWGICADQLEALAKTL